MKTPSSLHRLTPGLATELLELFYPVHYKGGMALEDAMRSGRLTRKQVAILWLIRSEGEEGKRMARKEIERLLTTWFEVSSSAITKALRNMARPPLSLVQVIEDPRSGRERQVLLTAKGEKFLVLMLTQGQALLQTIVEQLPEEETKAGIQFLRKATAVFEQLRAVQVSRLKQGKSAA
jgi:DNA-binding MarR family transcriptional regulator